MKLTFDYKIILGLIVVTFVNMVITCWPVAELDDFERAYQRSPTQQMVQTPKPAATMVTAIATQQVVTTPTLAALPLVAVQP